MSVLPWSSSDVKVNSWVSGVDKVNPRGLSDDVRETPEEKYKNLETGSKKIK